MRVTQATQEAIADAAWTVATRAPEFGYGEIVAALKISIKVVRRIVLDWELAGLIVLAGQGARQRKLWRVANPERRPAPRKRSREENMWTAMRKSKSFSPTDIAAHAAVEVSPEVAQDYCRALMTAGFLRVLVKAVPGRREATYRLIRDTGPLAPVSRRVSAVIDPNTKAVTVIGGGL